MGSSVALPTAAQSADDLILEAEQALLDYDFTQAANLLAKAKKKVKKSETYTLQTIDETQGRMEKAEEFLERVEKIEILDSIAVPRKDFFKAYRLPMSAGILTDLSPLGANVSVMDTTANYLFTNENGDYRIWSQPDSTGYMRLTESIRLTDGSWSAPEALPSFGDEDSDAVFPFMMADGVTLYYADNSEESIGGYDIMVVTRDASDGTFLHPQNIGMPYNSPSDDYLLAIDELNGVGWWATDRNRLPGDMITIYLYKTNDLRKNYDSEDEDDIVGKARLADWRSTADPENDNSSLLAEVRAIKPGTLKKKADFHLPMGAGREYTSYDDFKNSAAAAAMKRYLRDKESFDDDLAQLDHLRRQYHANPSTSLKSEISILENQIDGKRASLSRSLSDVYKAERR